METGFFVPNASSLFPICLLYLLLQYYIAFDLLASSVDFFTEKKSYFFPPNISSEVM